MTIKQYRAHFNKSIKHLYPTSEIDSFFFLILEEYIGFKRIDIVLKSDFKAISILFKPMYSSNIRKKKESISEVG